MREVVVVGTIRAELEYNAQIHTALHNYNQTNHHISYSECFPFEL